MEIQKEVERKKQVYSVMRVDAAQEGFTEGAIVVRRYTGGHNASLIPANWGIVSSLTSYHPDEKLYRPINVNWRNNNVTSHFIEDLYLIHRAIPKEELELMFSIQDEEVSEKEVVID
jgi:hypothetical protein